MRVILGATLSILIVAYCSIHYFQHRNARVVVDKTAPIVDVISAEVTHVRQFITVNGVAKAIRSVDVVSDVSGKINKILFKSGQYVHQGDLLIVLDHETETAALEEAEAKLRYQQKNFQRYVLLAKKELIAKDNLDNLKSQLDQIKAQIHRLQAELDKRFIRAPFEGSLGIKQINLGSHVEPGTLLVNLQRKNRLLLDLSVPERYIKTLSIGQTIQIKEDTLESGKIVAFDSSINNQTHSLLVRAIIDNRISTLIPGQFITAYLPLTDNNVIRVPLSAINYDASGSTIFVIKNQKAYMQPIEVEITDDDYAIVKKGLKVGDVVVCAGQAKLFDGIKVKIRTEAKNAFH